MISYRAKQGDMVDAICKQFYGTETMVEEVYDANPGLAAHGAYLPLGTIVKMPEVNPKPVVQPIRLWG